jgi:hypothetical protein
MLLDGHHRQHRGLLAVGVGPSAECVLAVLPQNLEVMNSLTADLEG